MTRSGYLSLNLVLLALLVGGALFTYGELPDRIPMHYGADGEPTRYARTSWLSWMALPVIAVVLSGLMAWVGVFIRKRPDWLNTPDPKRFRKLSDQDKQVIVEQQLDLLAVITLGMNLMFLAIKWGDYQVTMGHTTNLPWASGLAIGGFMVFTLVVAVRGMVQANNLIKELSDA